MGKISLIKLLKHCDSVGVSRRPLHPPAVGFPQWTRRTAPARKEHIPRCHPLQEFSDELLKTGNVVLRVLRAPDISRVD